MREGCTQIQCQTFNHSRAPTLLCLAGQNIVTDLPVQQHQLAVHRQRGALLSAMNAAFKIAQPVTVALGLRTQTNRSFTHCFFSRDHASVLETSAGHRCNRWQGAQHKPFKFGLFV